MKRKFIIGLTLMLSLALLGIVLVQFLWIRRAFNENQQRFDRNVSEVLDKVALRLEKQENLDMLQKRVEVKYSKDEKKRKPEIPRLVRSTTITHQGHISKKVQIIRNGDRDTNSKIIIWVNDTNSSPKQSYS